MSSPRLANAFAVEMGLSHGSMCANRPSSKQTLRVFHEITFVDPVDDAQWRAKLFSDLESHDPEFARYQRIDAALTALIQQDCVKRFHPDNTSTIVP